MSENVEDNFDHFLVIVYPEEIVHFFAHVFARLYILHAGEAPVHEIKKNKINIDL